MRFVSTSGHAAGDSLRRVVVESLAPDGGLWMPETVPALSAERWNELLDATATELAIGVLSPFLADALDAASIRSLIEESVDLPLPLLPLGESTWLLELHHGPTLAFKDFGARFLSCLLRRLSPGEKRRTVLVATSGDTGSAVASAFHGQAGTRVAVLYPLGRVSERQEKQFATLGGNVSALAVDGDFDTCQRLVKAALAEPSLVRSFGLVSANSIHFGRLLPQVLFYAHAAAELRRRSFGRHPAAPLFCVPCGNFGSLTAGLLASAMGLPTAGFLAATNANDVVPRYLESGAFEPRPTVPTLANAMDVGDPNNWRRVEHLLGGDLASVRRMVRGSAHSDAEILDSISEADRDHGVVLDPHGAVAYRAAINHRTATGDRSPLVVLGTAHPAKFAEIVEPAIGRPVEVPERLERRLAKPVERQALTASRSALSEALARAWSSRREKLAEEVR